MHTPHSLVSPDNQNVTFVELFFDLVFVFAITQVVGLLHDHLGQLATLAATGVAFFLAVSLPGAFDERALWFAVPYLLVRGIGLTLYSRVSMVPGPRQWAVVVS